MMVADGFTASRSLSHGDRIYIVIFVFLSIALYNVVELCVLIATTFKRFRGLYCWSFLVATGGIALNAAGYLVRAMGGPPSVYATIIVVGWWAMITGQSLVLYSRLQIVLHWENFLRGILIMIIANAIWLGVPLTVLLYLSNSPNPGPYAGPYSIFEKIQLAVFFVQESIISLLYVAETFKILRSHRGLASGGTRRMMSHLILINLAIIALGISILCLQFANHYDLQTAWKPLVYGIKLKMEFSVLNCLVDLSQRVRRDRGLALIGTSPVDATSLPLDVVDVVDVIDGGERSANDHSRPQSSAEDKSKASQPDLVVSQTQP